MAKVQLISCHPPQMAEGRRIEAAHYRTRQFLDALIERGDEILLCAGGRDEPAPGVVGMSENGVVYRHIPFGQNGWISRLQKSHDEFRPDCIVAVNFSHCLYATRLATRKPLWMDIYGDMVTIQQAYCYRTGSNRGIPTTIRFLRDILQSGDMFSACGEPQRHMLVGELAMTGRLNYRTFGYEFVRVVPPGSPPASPAGSEAAVVSLRSSLGLTAEDVVVLWCGGYNTWTDVQTLFEGLERAMGKNPNLHYVSVGDSTYSAAQTVYSRFRELIQDSPYRNRYHLCGWQPWQRIPDYYRISHIGLNIDALHYETLYGTRTRLVEMVGAGLPVLSTCGTELGDILEQSGAALLFEVGRAEQLGSHLLRLATDKELRENMGVAAVACTRGRLSFSKTTASFRSWIQAPMLAPDRGGKGSSTTGCEVTHRARAFVRNLLWQWTGADK